jgi:hypothetical protein
MTHRLRLAILLGCAFVSVSYGLRAAPPGKLDELIAKHNEGRKIQPAPDIDDLAYLRRVTIDLIGRIPTEGEIKQYLALPAAERRGKVVDRLLADERFADRWTVFFGDMLRIRSGAEGGAPFTAFIHKALETGMPYDELCRRLISANGKPGRTPEVGYILGDGADPMALAASTAQVFMGVRIACAQCHNHPFDVWTREQFYGFAAYFGKTRRIESQLTRVVYTTEANDTTILWPPEDEAKGGTRKPMPPKFPFQTVAANETPEFIARLNKLRAEQLARATKKADTTLDDLLATADDKVNSAAGGSLPGILDVSGDIKKERAKLDVTGDLYRTSVLRKELAEMVTSPRNRYFAMCLTNRVWADLVGRGFVDPIDDFSQDNAPSHPGALDYLADEFVAGGYDLKNLLRIIVGSQAYSRGRLTGVDEAVRQESEAAFVAAPTRRMLAETMFDSIAQAGHLFQYKYPAGANKKIVKRLVQVPVGTGEKGLASIAPGNKQPGEKMMAKPVVTQSPYDLESAVALDFNAILKAAAKEDEPSVEKMAVMSKEEIEAMRMMEERNNRNPRMRYVERYVDFEVDDNPKFDSAMRMASPAPPAHFLRIFGQTERAELGKHRDDNPSMRQALMMLNGKLTHEAARVGDFEPVYALLIGAKANVNEAIKLVYREILTREPSAEEVAEGKEIIAAATSPREGMADLRWLLFNCHEFRFLP